MGVLLIQLLLSPLHKAQRNIDPYIITPLLQFMVMSFTTKRLLIYDREEDMENGPGPITTLEFSQIYTVRTLRAGEHETFRVKQSNLKKILVVRSVVEEG